MAPLRFRAWCGKHEKYEPLNEASIGISTDSMFAVDKIIIEQSTGLHDKSGMEIFEGDIVKAQETEFRADWSKWESVVSEVRQVGWFVEWYRCGFQFRELNSRDEWWPKKWLYPGQAWMRDVYQSDPVKTELVADIHRDRSKQYEYRDFEIIGNIHENPELLEGK